MNFILNARLEKVVTETKFEALDLLPVIFEYIGDVWLIRKETVITV
jgi:hypothetical protein